MDWFYLQQAPVFLFFSFFINKITTKTFCFVSDDVQTSEITSVIWW